jgi:hypothetical protein
MYATTVDFHPQEVPPKPIGSVPFHQWHFPDGTLWTSFYRTEEGYLLRFPFLADFALDALGRNVRAWAAAGVDDATIENLYLNQILPLAWSKQGKLVLHGSAVEVDGQAIAFIGRSGLGKSTLAASFATAGYKFLTDDGLVLERSAAGYNAMPSHPSIRLWEDSQEALIAGPHELSIPVQYSSKVRFLAGKAIAFCAEPRPSHRLYFLGNEVVSLDVV